MVIHRQKKTREMSLTIHRLLQLLAHFQCHFPNGLVWIDDRFFFFLPHTIAIFNTFFVSHLRDGPSQSRSHRSDRRAIIGITVQDIFQISCNEIYVFPSRNINGGVCGVCIFHKFHLIPNPETSLFNGKNIRVFSRE